MTAGDIGNRHPGLGCLGQNRQLLVQRVTSPTLDARKNFDSINTRHSRMTRLTPSPSLCSYVRFKGGPFQELERCLNDDGSPIDKDTANNLRFLIGLRHEIEHQMTLALDNYLSARYQACALNYNSYLKKLFGKNEGIEEQLTYSIQFLQLADEQVAGPLPAADIPPRLLAYIADFDAGLKHEEYNSSKYAYRLLFHRKLVNRAGQADRVIEFLDPDSDAAKAIDKEFWVKKEVEKPKFLAKGVVAEVQKAGFTAFRTRPEHVAMWKTEDAKREGKGYGVMIQGVWYWYQSWVDRCIELCRLAGERYVAKA